MTGHVAFLGLGAMGQRMARRLLEAGNTVVVWNRDPAKTTPLQAAGAQVAKTPGAAAKGACVVVSMVRDDDASRRVWCASDDGALASMDGNAVAVECSTLSQAWVRELAGAAANRSGPFLDAPVAGSRPQAESGQLIHLVGGDPRLLHRAEPFFKAWSATVLHVGPNGSGTLAKLMLNQLFAVQVAAMAEIIAQARATEVDVACLVDAMSATPVCSPALKMASLAMLGSNHPPQFPLQLVAKDLSYAASSAHGATHPIAEAVQRTVGNALASGLGEQNITALCRLYGD
jgi:3-hydroxyisobutyrate dehydrogenase